MSHNTKLTTPTPPTLPPNARLDFGWQRARWYCVRQPRRAGVPERVSDADHCRIGLPFVKTGGPTPSFGWEGRGEEAVGTAAVDPPLEPKDGDARRMAFG